MKKVLKWFFWIWVFIVLVSFTRADIRDNLQHYYNFTSDAKDSIGGIDGSVTGATFVSSAGIVDGYYHFDGNNDCIVVDGISQLDENTGFTINFWVNGTGGSQSVDDLFSWGDDAGQNGIFPIGWGSGSKIEYFLRDATGDSVNKGIPNADTSNNYFSKGWTMFTMTFNYSGGSFYWKIFLNGTVADNTGSNTLGTYGFENGAFGCLRRQNANVNYGLGDLDEVGIWNITLNTLELEGLFKMYLDGCNPVNNNTCAGGGVPSPTLTLYTNLTNGTINYNNPRLSFNYSGVFTDNTKDICNITFFLNGVSNITLLDVNLSNQNYFNITFPYNYENWFNISLNASNDEVSASTITYFYNVDLYGEMINTTCINNSVYVQGNSFYCNVTYTDVNLFATNTTVFDGNNLVWNSESYFYENLTVSSMVVNLSYSLTDLGNFTIIFNSWDSHTNLELSNYKIDYLSNGLEFEDSIKIYSDDVIKTDTNKFYDRYDFSFTYDKNATVWKSIFIETTGSLYYVQNSIYKYHLVDFKNKKWIDFEGFEMPLAEIIRHSSNKYEIKFRSEETEIKFNSIGDLNEDILIFQYQVISPTSDVNLTGIENALNNIYNVFEGGFTMMMLIIFCGLFLVLGVIVKFYYMWFFSALGFAIIGVDYIMRIVNEGEDFTLNFLIAITFVVLSFILVLLAYILQARLNNLQNKDKYDLYDIY